jgi:raffinose/stachyose/melibiose transport system permease protein
MTTATHARRTGAGQAARKVLTPGATFVLAGTLAIGPVAPLLWIIFTAFKDRGRVIRDPLALPSAWHWENFREAWRVGNFDTYFGNSLLVALPTVAGVLLFSLMAAYAFALMRFRGRRGLFILFLLGLTIPLTVLIIPLFYEIRAMGLLNSLWALILPQIAIQLPFGILLLYGFIRHLPGEILDAGMIDGCNHWTLLRHIVTPLCRPALLTLLVFTFMWTWNQFLLPVVVIHTDAARTLPVGLAFFQGRYTTDLPLLMAGATITFLPVIIVYAIFQRQFIQGIAAGAFK